MMSKMALGTALSKLLRLQKLGASTKFASITLLRRKHKHASSNIEMENFGFLPIINERLLKYESGSPEREQVKTELSKILNGIEQVPIVVCGSENFDNGKHVQILPFNIQRQIARYNHAKRSLIDICIENVIGIQKLWDKVSLFTRIEIWERGAELISTKYRFKIVAAIMLGQGKTLQQAEIDVAELVDVMRINSIYLHDLSGFVAHNPDPKVCRNQIVFRGLPGFVAAISPFNYTSIAANMAYSPALMGNVVLWKPSDSAILSNWYVFQAMREAGVPDGVVNFMPAHPAVFSKAVTQSRKLAGINFTGRAAVLKVLWKMVADQINYYDHYPRLMGECGGKNFHFIHSSANVEDAVACTIRAAFEYAGQKCSSCSMLYVPESLWESQIKQPLLDIARSLFVSDATYCDCFYSAVIDRAAYQRIFSYLKYIHNDSHCQLLLGGTGSMSQGYYVDPTVVQVTNLDSFLCKDELMAPILCVYVYKDDELANTVQKVAKVNRGLTASVFATDDQFIMEACDAFRHNVGNLNINDKCTGSMMAQQPFGAGSISGTNEKMGCPQYLHRWTSLQTVKESLVPHRNVFYPYMGIKTVETTTRASTKTE